ncbi:meckelin [Halictus rubicundus]|uniref:meckelin n=1 Tax=Halictus rubicundus TaxID=77578 RepID=UPI0040372B41
MYIHTAKMNFFVSKNIFLIFHFAFFQLLSANKEVIELSQLWNCKSNEYFDSGSLSCIHCDTNKNLKPSADRLRCVCNEFSKQVTLKDGYPECIFCGYNRTVTTDRKRCVSCNSTTCECTINEIQLDRSINGTLLDTMYCFSCPNNTYPSLDRSKCLSCDDFENNYYLNPIYSTQYYTWIQDHCLNKNVFTNDPYTNITNLIKFKNHNVDSYYFRKDLEVALYLCKKEYKLACEYLSNLCVLSLYSNKIACVLFMQIQTIPVWLFYNKNETVTTLNSKKITQRYSLSRYNNDSTLNFKMATFSLHGNFKSLDTPNMPCDLLENVQFGVNYKNKCILKIKDLLSADIEFISPYLTFVDKKKVLMHALPVLIKNMNQNTNDISQWQFVRKFFLVDNISGYRTLNITDNETKRSNKLSSLIYMKSLTVIVNVQSAEARDKILPPLLIVEYTKLTYEQMSEITHVVLDYKIKFILEHSHIDIVFKIIIAVFLGLAICYSAIKTWNYNKQHYTTFSYLRTLFWFFIYTMGSIGTIIIISLISLCMYLFIFYKGQTTPYILFSDDINEKTIKIFTAITVLFKFVEMFGFICRCWNLNIFFIDWEQPKAVSNQFEYDSSYTSLHKSHRNKFSKHKNKSLYTKTEIKTTKQKQRINEPADCSSSTYNEDEVNFSAVYSVSEGSMQAAYEQNNFHNSSVSIWRTYYIINHWLNLQTMRKINVMVQLLAVLSIFQIVQLYPWIFAIPEIPSNFSEDNNNFILYYTVCVLMYILIYCIQWLLYIGFYEQCIRNKIQEFINLCSTVNISFLILPYNYYGFYIHGRSVHGIADTDLTTLMNNLEKEKNNLCACKGLLPGTDQQTFILSLTKTLRIVLIEFSKQTKVSLNSFLGTNDMSTKKWELIFNAQIKLKQFLCKFVDHCFKDMDYIIKDQQFLEKLCNIMFSQIEEKSVFYIDNNHSFDQVLLYGNEWLLATFELSIFAFMVAVSKDCVLAITVTMILSTLLLLIIKHNGKKNLYNNVLPDKTFLM